MAKTGKVTDLTKLEGDPDPLRADPQMHVEVEAHAPWQAGVIKFIAQCSERSSVAAAVVTSILILMGIACVAAAHMALALAGLGHGWVTAAISLGALFIPYGVYCRLRRRESRS